MRISKIILYDEPSVPEINIHQLSDFIKRTFSIDTIVRKNIFQDRESEVAKDVASCRIINTKKPFEFHSPSSDEIEFEKETFLNSSKIKNIIMYDGFEFQKIISDLISEDENSIDIFHVIFTNRLTCTYDFDDYRYHGRAIICSNPTIISTTGIIEAPAKPKEYYMDLILNMTQGLNMDLLKQKYQGSYLEYHDKRISTVVEGYVMQSLFYYLTGEAFCDKVNCRLFNPHWQQDLIQSQIKNGELCEKHQKTLEKLVFDLNS